MEFGIKDLLTAIGALAFFVYGMKMMSDGIQRAAGSQLRNILRSMTKNRFLGVFTGFLTTALVQSSSATTVMTVSFVNAGLLTLVESAGVMMGANIGTTITAWIISILGLKISLSAYSYPLFVLGVPMLLSGKDKIKYWGEFLVGFAILFLGLSALKDSVPDLDANSGFLTALKDFSSYGFISRVVFVMVGALVTVIVQSSSAAMAVTLTLCYNGWLPLDVAAAMVLGENIGTTITAEVASLVGNTNAKRSARIHSMFNLIGVTWMIILMPFVLPYLSDFVENFSDIFDRGVELKAENLSEKEKLTTFTLSAFHTTFNLLNVLILLPFVGFLVKAAIWSVKEKESDQSPDKLKFISTLTKTAELALPELQKETAHFGEVVSKMSELTSSLLNSTKSKEQNKLIKKIKKYEDISDQMEIEITQYITKLSSDEVTPKTSQKLRSILNICNDLERIGDIYYQVSKAIEQKIEDRSYFTPEQRNSINRMSAKIDEAFANMIANLNKDYDKVSIEKANILEDEINVIRDELRNSNLNNLGAPDYNIKSAMIYNNIFSSLEQVGDHIMNISESLIGEI